MVSAGQQIGFTISVENSSDAGTGTAYDVELGDLLPFKAGGSVDWEIGPAYAGPGSCAITGALSAPRPCTATSATWGPVTRPASMS